MAELDIYGICQTCKEEHAIEDIKLTCEWCVEETPIREAIKECFTKISFIKDLKICCFHRGEIICSPASTTWIQGCSFV